MVRKHVTTAVKGHLKHVLKDCKELKKLMSKVGMFPNLSTVFTSVQMICFNA